MDSLRLSIPQYIVVLITVALSWYLGFHQGTKTVPKEVTKEVTVYRDFKLNEWKCEDIGHEWDLLQPTGYWINHDFQCWKKAMELEEYCFKFECSSDWYKNYYQELRSK